MTEQKYYTVEEIADLCRLSPRTIKNHILSGDLTAYKIGRQYRITETDFKEYIAKAKIN